MQDVYQQNIGGPSNQVLVVANITAESHANPLPATGVSAGCAAMLVLTCLA